MIYLIIPVFNRWHFTKVCLENLMKQTYHDFKIIVIDHGSTDETNYQIRTNYPYVILLSGDESMWWAEATNVGLRYSLEENPDFILTLNNDTIPSENYLEEIINAYNSSPKNSLIGSCAVDEKTKEIIYCGEKFNWFLDKSSLHKKLPNIETLQTIEVSFFPGRGLLIPLEVVKQIGLYDSKNFPHYVADYDYTLRAKDKGFNLYCAIQAKIIMYPEASGASNLIKNKNIKSYYKHLFGMHGAANLKLFLKYAIRHCPIYALPFYLFVGTSRRLIGYWLK